MKIFEKIVASAERMTVEKAWKGGRMCCPHCGGALALRPEDAESMVRCGGCGHEALPMEWIPARYGVLKGHADRVPAHTRIRREEGSQGSWVWHIPASGKFGFFLFFGTFWLAITAAVSGGFLLAALKGDAGFPWFIYPFFAMFWIIGIGCIYAAVRNKFARHQLIVTQDMVMLRRELFGRTKEKSLAIVEVEKVEQAVFYQQNYQPIYGVEIRGRRGKLRFGTTLSEAEKAWLVADIGRAVFGAPEAAAAPVMAATPEVEAAIVAARRQSSFSFPLPPASRSGWIFGGVFIIIGIVATGVGFNLGPDCSGGHRADTPWFVLVFNAIFSIASLIPIFVGLVSFVIGVAMLKSIWPSPGRDKRLEGDEIQVALRIYQHGRVMKEQAFPRESVRGARATRCGAINEKVMKRIDLIVDGKAKRMTSWTEGDAADAWVAGVNDALG